MEKVMVDGDLTRRERFEAVIAKFLNDKRANEELKKQGAKPGKYNKSDWLDKTSEILARTSVQIGTHIPKAVHSDVKGGVIHATNLPQRREVGSHSLSGAMEADASGNGAENAAVLEGWHFLHLPIEAEGRKRPLHEWLADKDADALAALSEIAGRSDLIAERFLSFLAREDERRDKPVSDGNAKQLYWLEGADAAVDEDFILLQPVYPSSLSHAIYQKVQADRWGMDDEDKERLKAARLARKEKKAWFGILTEYPRMAKRMLGGTKPQNVSQLNSLRRGEAILFSCAPPNAEWKRRAPLLRREDTVVAWMVEKVGVRKSLEKLAELMTSHLNKEGNMHFRNRRDRLLDGIIAGILEEADKIKFSWQPGWSADGECKMPMEERLWLDTGRVENEQEFSSPEDWDFREHYHAGEWADQVADTIARVMTQYLSKKGLPVGDAGHDFFARIPSLILDTSWPTPMKRKSVAQRRSDLSRHRKVESA